MRATCIVSLAAFERDLLNTVKNGLKEQITEEALSLQLRLFERWEWARDVRRTFEECLSAEKKKEYEGDIRLLGRLFHHTLEHSPEHGNRKFRTRLL